uniref:Uncharacterized protein n=1 Tax=Oryza punctata TaxID=4537 RepID=A0A0E0K4A7_ORYPU
MRRKQQDERRRPCSLTGWMGIGAGGGGGGCAHQDGCVGSSRTNDGAPARSRDGWGSSAAAGGKLTRGIAIS